MTKRRSTKSALISSILALFLCITMLVGTTFAWFTDSVTSSNNKIVAGNLKIDLELLDKASGTWASIKESKAPIFTYDNWEPGYVDVKVLKVENEGSLALKWGAKFVSDVELSILADVIDVYVLPSATELTYPTDRALSGYERVGTVREFVNTIEQTTKGTLASGCEAYLGIALKMQESAGNEYQEKTIGAFDIQILATQLDSEIDSFGSDYDADLPFPDEDGDMLVEKNNVQYLYRADGTHWLYYVTPDYTGDTVVVPEGVTTIGGSSFSYNTNVKTVVFSSTVTTVRTNMLKGNTSVEKIVLNEGLTDLSTYERAFNQAKGLKEVVFPSTLKRIGKQAFALTAMEELTIPANVETMLEGAFREMPNLKTVTIEGNTEIGEFAFRTCKDLETVYLLGDDVTFAGTSMAFTHADSGDANGITIFVANETVAQRVRAAQGSAYGYNVRIIGQPLSIRVETTEELLAALNNITEPTIIDATGVTAVVTGDLNTTLTVPAGVTLKGANIIANGTAFLLIGNGEEQVVFENCSFAGVDRSAYNIATNGADATFKNCEFKGQITPNATAVLTATYTFENCTFTTSGGSGTIGYVNCMGGNHIFNNCTFDFTGGATYGSNQYTTWSAVNAYSENRFSTSVVLDGCTRINCGAVRIGPNASLTIR